MICINIFKDTSPETSSFCRSKAHKQFTFLELVIIMDARSFWNRPFNGSTTKKDWLFTWVHRVRKKGTRSQLSFCLSGYFTLAESTEIIQSPEAIATLENSETFQDRPSTRWWELIHDSPHWSRNKHLLGTSYHLKQKRPLWTTFANHNRDDDQTNHTLIRTDQLCIPLAPSHPDSSFTQAQFTAVLWRYTWRSLHLFICSFS